MYLIKVTSWDGIPRYVINKPVGTEKVLYSVDYANAYAFEDLTAAKHIRDDTLEDNEHASVLRIINA